MFNTGTIGHPFFIMIRTKEDYKIKEIKRRKEAVCRYCLTLINKGEIANIVDCINSYFDGINTIGITHKNCTNNFIELNIKESLNN